MVTLLEKNYASTNARGNTRSISTNVENHTSNLGTFINEEFKQLESQVAMLGSKLGVGKYKKENKGNLLSMEIHNTLLVGTYKDIKFKKFNGEIDPITHLQGFEYTWN